MNCPTIFIDEDGFSEYGAKVLELWKQYYPLIANSDGPYYAADLIGMIGLAGVGGAYIVDSFVNIYDYFSTLSAITAAASVEKNLQGIAEDFGDFKCIEATEAMKEYLKKKKIHGYEITIQYPTYPGYVFTKMYDRMISKNGIHVGVEYNGLVYCNVHPGGLPYEEWINDFEAVGQRTVTRVPF